MVFVCDKVKATWVESLSSSTQVPQVKGTMYNYCTWIEVDREWLHHSSATD